jgi:hypothetical protein
VGLAIFGTACLDSCPNVWLPYQDLDATLRLDGSGTSLATVVDLLPESSDGRIWRQFVADSSSAPPAVGVLFLANINFGFLVLNLPFPLAAGQTLPLTRRPSGDNTDNFKILPPSTSGAAAWINTCSYLHTNCGLSTAQVVNGTIEVQAVQPPQVRINAVFSDPSDPMAAPVSVSGLLTFAIEPVKQECSSYND